MAKISKLLVKKENINYIKTNKYKDINLVVKCADNYERNLFTSLKLMSLMMMDTSKNYPTKNEFAKAKDMLFGLNYALIPSHYSDLVTLTISYNFTNPKFIDNFEENDCILFIDETITNPNFNESFLTEAKRNLIDSINRKLDNPTYLALDNLAKEIAKDDDRFKVYVESSEDEINSVTLNDIINTYNEIFNHRIDVYLIGDYGKELEDYVLKFKSKEDLHAKCLPLSLNNPIDINFKKEIGQSTLLVTYKSEFVRTSKEFYAYNLGNIVLGGIPSSLLFSEVREKNSLCYSIYSRVNKCEGLLTILTNIDSKNKEKALNEIKNQYNRIVEKDYDLSLIDVARIMLKNNSATIDDDLDYLIDYSYSNLLLGINVSIEEYGKEIDKITADDISYCFKKTKQHAVYFLEGINHE